MNKNNVINLNEYRQKRVSKNVSKLSKINSFKKENEEDRRNTFNLFMRVLATMRQESY